MLNSGFVNYVAFKCMHFDSCIPACWKDYSLAPWFWLSLHFKDWKDTKVYKGRLDWALICGHPDTCKHLRRSRLWIPCEHLTYQHGVPGACTYVCMQVFCRRDHISLKWQSSHYVGCMGATNTIYYVLQSLLQWAC